jgi:hypothetical protein
MFKTAAENMKSNRWPLMLLVLALAAVLCLWATHLLKPFSTFACAHGTCAVRDIDRTAYRDTRWYELGPKGWDPYKLSAELRKNVGSFSDSDPRAAELLKKLKAIWVDAPINPDLEGRTIRMPGYVVPLDSDRDGMGEFLLVPYFGACIHTPPPPSNQILHVVLPLRAQGIKSMEEVWVRGTLSAARSDTSMGASGYLLDAVSIEPLVR